MQPSRAPGRPPTDRRSDSRVGRCGRTCADRRGMTLVELLIVLVVGGLVMLAIYEVLIVNQRTYRAQSATVRGQQTLRAGMDVLFGELREISPADGDIVAMAEDELEIRAPRNLAVICEIVVGGTDPTIRARRIGRDLVEDSARVFYENDSNDTSDDVWRSARIGVVDVGSFDCPDGTPAQTLQLHGVTHGMGTDDFLVTGSPIRNFLHFRYGVGTYDGRSYLVQEDTTGTEFPLVGPLDDADPADFEYLDENGTTTTTPEDVRQVEVTLRTVSEARDGSGDPYRDSLTARIFTRN